MSTTSADPQHLADYASGLSTTEEWLAAHGQPLQDALDRFVRTAVEFGFCPAVTGAAVEDHAARGAALAEWTGAVGHAVATADVAHVELVGWIGGSPRTVWSEDVDSHLLALGAFAIPEETASWRAGTRLGAAVHEALDARDADAAETLLRSLGELEENELALAAALAALGDLDLVEQRIADLRPKGSLAGRFLGGAWDATTGTLSTAWNLTGRGLHDPSGFGRAWGDLGSGLWWGVRNPDDFALAVIDWEGLQDDPVRWLGGLVPDAAAAVASGGTAAAATRGTSATRMTVRAIRGAESVGDVLDALRRLPDQLVVDVSGRLRTIGGRQVTWSPAGRADEAGEISTVVLGTGRGPLSRLTDDFPVDPTTTFRGHQYVVRRTDEPLTLYRVSTELWPDGAPRAEVGPFWSTIEPGGFTQAQLDSALVPSWGNRAERVTVIEVPAGETIYEGMAAPQPIARRPDDSIIPGTTSEVYGGGPQVVLPNVPREWITDVHVLDPGS